MAAPAPIPRPGLLSVSYSMLDDASTQFENFLNAKLHDTVPLPGVEAAEVFRVPAEAPKPTVIFVLGGPGAGKGTQCAKIVSEFGYCHISAGDCLREERASGSPDAELINNFIREGKIVPVEITIKLLLKAMRTSGNDKFLIDGFPRDIDNLHGWNRVVGDTVNVAFVMFFDCPEDTMLVRLLSRGETSGRIDDNITSIRKRFLVFHESTMPVVHSFEAQGKVRFINAAQPPELVYLNVQRILRNLAPTLRPRQQFVVQYRLPDVAAVASTLTEHEKFVAELSKKLPGGGLVVTPTTLHKVVEAVKPAEGGSCVIS